MNVVRENIDADLQNGKDQIMRHLQSNNFNTKSCSIIYGIRNISSNSDEICKNLLNDDFVNYNDYFKYWNSSSNFITAYILDKEQKYFAKSSIHSLIYNPKSLNSYNIEIKILQKVLEQKYIAFAAVDCENPKVIGFNNSTIDVYEIDGEALKLLSTHTKK